MGRLAPHVYALAQRAFSSMKVRDSAARAFYAHIEEHAHLEHAHIEHAHLEYAHLEDQHLERAHLEDQHLERAHLEDRQGEEREI
jgi:uncharacterized protein YjbI with pentapeptide repeats